MFVFVIKPIPVESRDIGSVLLAMPDRHLNFILFDRLKFLNVTTPIRYDQSVSFSRFPVAEKNSSASIRSSLRVVSSLLVSLVTERDSRASPVLVSFNFLLARADIIDRKSYRSFRSALVGAEDPEERCRRSRG